mgnify:CR=1 FL=1
MCVTHINGKLRIVPCAHTIRSMNDFAANLLGVVGLAVADRITKTARDTLNHVGETPAALVVIGYDLGPSNEELRRILGLSHPGSVRLVDRLVADGLVERRKAQDKRAVALYLTKQGKRVRKTLLKGRLAAVHPFLESMSKSEMETLTALLHKMLSSLEPTDLERCTLCRLCDGSVCTNCPIPADFRG